MSSLETPQFFCDLLEAFDKLGIDYLTLLETKNDEYYVEGYVVNANPSTHENIKLQISELVKRCGLRIKETDDGVLVYKTKQT